jgi:Flp pilus assembly protein TadG
MDIRNLRLPQRLRSLMANVGRDRQGMAAVEFAMIAPLMFTLFVGVVEFSQALTVDRRVGQAASATADLIARAPSSGLTTDDVDASMRIVQQLMAPYSTAPLLVKIVSVKASTNMSGALTYTVDWSRDSAGGTPYERNSSYANIPVDLLSSGESVIVSETTYRYSPLIFSYFITSAFNMSETFYLKPRNASCVTLKPISCVDGSSV